MSEKPMVSAMHPRRWFYKIDDCFYCVGRWELGLFDDGWIIARDMVIKAEGRWPTYKTFHR